MSCTHSLYFSELGDLCGIYHIIEVLCGKGNLVLCSEIMLVPRYVRAEVVAGFVNTLFLLFVAFFIFAEAIEVSAHTQTLSFSLSLSLLNPQCFVETDVVCVYMCLCLCAAFL